MAHLTDKSAFAAVKTGTKKADPFAGAKAAAVSFIDPRIIARENERRREERENERRREERAKMCRRIYPANQYGAIILLDTPYGLSVVFKYTENDNGRGTIIMGNNRSSSFEDLTRSIYNTTEGVFNLRSKYLESLTSLMINQDSSDNRMRVRVARINDASIHLSSFKNNQTILSSAPEYNVKLTRIFVSTILETGFMNHRNPFYVTDTTSNMNLVRINTQDASLLRELLITNMNELSVRKVIMQIDAARNGFTTYSVMQ